MLTATPIQLYLGDQPVNMVLDTEPVNLGAEWQSKPADFKGALCIALKFKPTAHWAAASSKWEHHAPPARQDLYPAGTSAEISCVNIRNMVADVHTALEERMGTPVIWACAGELYLQRVPASRVFSGRLSYYAWIRNGAPLLSKLPALSTRTDRSLNMFDITPGQAWPELLPVQHLRGSHATTTTRRKDKGTSTFHQRILHHSTRRSCAAPMGATRADSAQQGASWHWLSNAFRYHQRSGAAGCNVHSTAQSRSI